VRVGSCKVQEIVDGLVARRYGDLFGALTHSLQSMVFSTRLRCRTKALKNLRLALELERNLQQSLCAVIVCRFNGGPMKVFRLLIWLVPAVAFAQNEPSRPASENPVATGKTVAPPSPRPRSNQPTVALPSSAVSGPWVGVEVGTRKRGEKWAMCLINRGWALTETSRGAQEPRQVKINLHHLALAIESASRFRLTQDPSAAGTSPPVTISAGNQSASAVSTLKPFILRYFGAQVWARQSPDAAEVVGEVNKICMPLVPE
jgi:hypothetical protein